jgi:hypothetical protein
MIKKLSFLITVIFFTSCNPILEPVYTCGEDDCNGQGTCLITAQNDLYCTCNSGYKYDDEAEIPEYTCKYVLIPDNCPEPDYNNNCGGGNDCKPVIYLYPEQIIDVRVKFKNSDDVDLLYVYPEYGIDGWIVTAYPDGTLYDEKTQREYYTLYWEGLTKKISFDEGFVVEGKNIIPFLEEKLELLGLNFKEANEFIIYWLPILEPSQYLLIHFATTKWTESVPLQVIPQPNTQIRFSMLYKPIPQPVEINPQTITKPQRTGFVLVEWGGKLID